MAQPCPLNLISCNLPSVAELHAEMNLVAARRDYRRARARRRPPARRNFAGVANDRE